MHCTQSLQIALHFSCDAPLTESPFSGMMHNMPRSSTLVALFLVAGGVCAQGREQRYVPIPFQGDFEALFKLRLQASQDESLRRFIEGFRGNVDGPWFLDPGRLQRLQDDPKLRALMKKLAPALEKNGQFIPKGLDIRNEMPSPEAQSRVPPGEMRPPPPPRTKKAWSFTRTRPERPRPDLLNQWLRDLSRQSEDIELGDWLRDSPALQKGLADLKSVLDAQANPWRWNPDSLPEGLRSSEGWLPQHFGDKLLDGIRNFQLPDMSRVNLPQINLPHVNLPSVNLPRVNVGRWGLPSLPSLGSPGAGAGPALLWFVVVTAVLIIAWQLARNIQRRVSLAPVHRGLGPWPVDPAKIMTRAELIKAFDYLALWRLGEQARSWNHRRVERRLSFSPEPAATVAVELSKHMSLPLPAVAAGSGLNKQYDAVAELTRMYESARYTIGPDILSPDEQAAVRHNLGLLVETAN